MTFTYIHKIICDGVGVPDISKHLKKKFESGELDKEVVVSKMEITTQHGAIEGKTQVSETAFYSLDVIISANRYHHSARIGTKSSFGSAR